MLIPYWSYVDPSLVRYRSLIIRRIAPQYLMEGTFFDALWTILLIFGLRITFGTFYGIFGLHILIYLNFIWTFFFLLPVELSLS